ncbi:hypothetical protein H0W26_01095 [Candidatus Dependentiae bacterium]|nr:hypothetical protein [Candidatus Dependentiae bacterium]
MAEQKSLIASLQEFTNSFQKPSSWYAELGAYVIAGFILGFLVKHGGRLFLILLLGAFLALWALDHFNIITVHYPTFKSVVGVPEHVTSSHAVETVTTWIKEHMIESLVIFFGFIIAWKFA